MGCTKDAHGSRLMFRRMDDDGSGRITRQKILRAARRRGLELDIANALFDVGDMHDQGALDYRNFVALFIDVDSMADEDLLQELRSVLNRLGGTRFGGCSCAATSTGKTNGKPLARICSHKLVDIPRHPSHTRMQDFVKNVSRFVSPGECTVDAGTLLRMLREPSLLQN